MKTAVNAATAETAEEDIGFDLQRRFANRL